MNSFDLRQKFFEFFKKRHHTVVPSSSLIPAEDPTLLFTNAGMNQFKDVFLGKETRNYTRAVSIQKCMRAGGKHNDLENVGFTKRHLTFFEMMGNFSFGNYFKQDAIKFAWEFLTQEIKLNTAALYTSVFYEDQESYDIWHKEIGLPKNKIVKLGEKDNFWQMGDTGPCGPATEIYIDRNLNNNISFDCPEENCAPGCDCDRFLEIWNLVFMQYDRKPNGKLEPLKKTGVDTGMGLERLCSIIENTDSVFETDLFKPIIKRIEELVNINYTTTTKEQQAAFRVLADHIRSSSFAIADGVTPSNEGRGYVLRKIIRRAALFTQKLTSKNIFPEIAPALINYMSPIYPELKASQELIIALLNSEIEKFSINLEHGQKILEQYFRENKDSSLITGTQAFKLYDTYGFPLELTKVIAQERNFNIDIHGFEKEMEKQKLQSGKKTKDHGICNLDINLKTTFTGYDELTTHSRISNLILDNKSVSSVESGLTAWIITDQSPFYVECGGQISDQGYIKIDDHLAPLLDLKKINNAIAAKIKTPIKLTTGDKVTLMVEPEFRINTMKNHTATHLLQAALLEVIGKNVKQSGSIVTPDYLRFDFTYHKNINPEQIEQIEDRVNAKIRENIQLIIRQTTLKEAQSEGVIAFFGEKYNPENVRIIKIPGFSAELCGGTHVDRTGDIGVFKITEAGALSAGNKRIVAVTGPKALELFQESFNTVKALGQEFKATSDKILDAIERQKEQFKIAQTEIKALKKQLYKTQIPEWLSQVKNINNIPYLYLEIPDANANDLKDIAQQLSGKQPGLYFLISSSEKTNFFVSLSQELKDKINLKKLSEYLKDFGLRGGTKDKIIQGGAIKIPENLNQKIKTWLENQA